MDEKIEEMLIVFFENLTDEQKEKVKECKTEQELNDFIEKEGIELPDELLEAASGGFDPSILVQYKKIPLISAELLTKILDSKESSDTKKGEQ